MARMTSFLVAFGLSAIGCAHHPAKIHLRFQELCPRRLQVAVENRTLHDNLENYSTSGLLQRTIFGPGAVDIPGEFRRSAIALAEERGYEAARGAEPLPGTMSASTSGPPADQTAEKLRPPATLHLRIRRWDRLPAHEGAGIECEFEAEIIDGEGKESLFFQSGHLQAVSRNPSGAGVTAMDIERNIRAAVGRALDELPACRQSAAGSRQAMEKKGG